MSSNRSSGAGFDPYLDFLDFYQKKLMEIKRELRNTPENQSIVKKIDSLYQSASSDIQSRKASHARDASKRDF